MSAQGKLSLKHPAILREDLRRICDDQSAPTLVAFAHGRMAINSENATSMNLRPAEKAGRSVFGQRSSETNVRYWPIADILAASHMSAFGGKADIAFCDANVYF
jgi:hypothetical protein